jgi:hypothetical protein
MNSFEDVDVTVTDANVEAAVEGVSLYPAAPVPGLQTIFTTVFKPNGNGDEDATISARVNSSPTWDAADESLMSRVTTDDTADSQGYMAVTLIKNLSYFVTVLDSAGKTIFAKMITVTTDDTANLYDYE